MKIDMVENCEVENKIKLDFKEDYKKWFKTLCAFANTSGGVMNVGINDDLEEVGFKLHEIDSIKRSVEAICRNHSEPTLKCKYEVIKIENKEEYYYLKVNVAQRQNAITWLVDDTSSPLLYVRHNGSTDLATVEEQVDLLSTSKMFEYDKVETGIRFDEVSFDELEEEYKSTNNNESLTKKKLMSFGLLSAEDYLTVAGVLFSDNSMNRNANISCTTWPSLNKGTNDYTDSKPYHGSLITLFHDAIGYIKSVTHYSFGGEKKGMYRSDTGSFSIVSLREAMINALAHRDYKIDGNEIAIDCFPDRVEITSPGSMLHNRNDVTRQKIDASSFASLRRNAVICNIFEKCNLMENKGSGFEKIVDDYKDMSEEYAPLFSANRISFTIVLKNKKYKYNDNLTENSTNGAKFEDMITKPMFLSRQSIYEKNPRYREIETFISNSKNISIEQLEKETGLSKDGVNYNIRRMKDACLIRKAEGGYELVNDIDRPADYLSLDKEILLKVVMWCKDNFLVGKTTLSGFTSYGLKHILEHDIKIYLTNGQFKAAMLLAGFETKNVEALNWEFKILKTSPAMTKEYGA